MIEILYNFITREIWKKPSSKNWSNLLITISYSNNNNFSYIPFPSKSLEKQIEYETEDGETDEECEQITEDGSDLDSITGIVGYYLEEGGTEESIC